jgi:hypothetical protein
LNKIFAELKKDDFIKEDVISCKTQSENLISNPEENDTIGCLPGSSENDKWFYISDSHVAEVNVAKVLKTQAYILFYERIQ